MNYNEFIAQKVKLDPATGLRDVPALNERLFEFQADITRWALKRGRAAVFADCGMGKGFMALEWAHRQPHECIIAAPLAVAQQFEREAAKFGVDICRANRQSEITKRIVVTNYDRLDNFDLVSFGAVVLDESSILKSYDGKTRAALTREFAAAPFRLCCTATPAPNDYMELGNHAEFLGVMTRSEMLATFFTHDGGDTSKWRLKGHAESRFWEWLCSWAVMIRKPSDLGYDDAGFQLPELVMHQVEVRIDEPGTGQLFPVEAQTLQERLQARRDTLADRVAHCASLVNSTNESFLVWCNLNSESQALVRAIPDAVEITGSDNSEKKESALVDFISGKTRVIVTKPLIAGFGINMQHCHNMAFVGLSDSYEQFYQAIRRCWRFGQTKPVNVYVITAQTEGAVVVNIKRKEADAERMAQNMIAHMQDLNGQAVRGSQRMNSDYEPTHEMEIPEWMAA